MCVGQTSYHCSRRWSESWKGKIIIPLAHSFRVFIHGEQSLSFWGWRKAWDLPHVLEQGILPQSIRTETREDPRTDIQLKAPSWYPTSTTRIYLIKSPPPSEDWVSNTWMPVRNISHGTLDITWPNMFIDILGVMMLPCDPYWDCLSLAVFGLLCVVLHFLAGELFSDMILFCSPFLDGSEITPEINLPHHHHALKTSETSRCGWLVPYFQLNESCEPTLLTARYWTLTKSFFYCIIASLEEYAYQYPEWPAQFTMPKKSCLKQTFWAEPIQGHSLQLWVKLDSKDQHNQPKLILLFLFCFFPKSPPVSLRISLCL